MIAILTTYRTGGSLSQFFFILALSSPFSSALSSFSQIQIKIQMRKASNLLTKSNYFRYDLGVCFFFSSNFQRPKLCYEFGIFLKTSELAIKMMECSFFSFLVSFYSFFLLSITFQPHIFGGCGCIYFFFKILSFLYNLLFS